MDKKKAIELIIEYEKKQGRNPERANKFKEGCDLKSGERFIDLKINGKKNPNILIRFSNFKKLGKNILRYYIYLLEEGGQKLKILEPDFIMKNLSLLTLINIKSDLINQLNNIDL